ncbi:Dolichyl-diphosphooligosaccharide--protein glycosyltransferase subunit WBP1 [Globomyces pollinis-pini]|nr:Dolichyl-diphosphooligosaccharide--protein glycosyltransferase subunit WBP1 [Globomyces pollinis-pini]
MKFTALIAFIGLVIAKTLVLLDTNRQEEFSLFLSLLKSRGHILDLQSISKVIPLIEFEEKKYDHVVVLGPVQSFGGQLKVGNLLEFVNQGGNVLLASSKPSEAINDFAYEFSVDFHTTPVKDYFSNINDTIITSANLLNSHHVVPKTVKAPILYRGVGHKLSGKNALVQPLLVGGESTYSIGSSALYGNKLGLVSYFQALNDARIVFVGSVDMFTNDFLNAAIKINGEEKLSGNAEFASEISEWVFKQKSVVKVVSHKHHRLGETAQHGIYRIKDEMVYELELAKLEKGKWVPFTPNDIQFEAVMLDPYIRRTFSSKDGKMQVRFKLPDHYGVFTFKVSYQRHGLTNVLVSETVQVRPFNHDQYPRFLLAAYPYYANIFSMMGAFFLFSCVFLYHKDTIKKVKTD